MKLLLLLTLCLVSCQQERGDQAHAREENLGVANKTLNEDDFDEDIQEMTPENTQREGMESSLERINENKVDDEIASAERHESYPAWKILLVVAGSAVGLVLFVASVILILKSRNNNKEGKCSEKESSVFKEDEAFPQVQSRVGGWESGFERVRSGRGLNCPKVPGGKKTRS